MYYGANYNNNDETRGFFVNPTKEPIQIDEPFKCKICHETFTFKNKLHSHLGHRVKGRFNPTKTCPGRSVMHARTKQEERWAIAYNNKAEPRVTAEPLQIITSDVDSAKDVGSGQAFRKYRYAHIKIQLSPKHPASEVCADSGCSVTLIERAFLKECLLDVQLRLNPAPLEVSGIGSDKHRATEYFISPLYIPDKDQDRKNALAKTAPREVHVVDGLRAGMLLGSDIMTPEGTDLILSRQVAMINSCKMEALIETRAKGLLMPRFVHAKKAVVIPSNATALVEVNHLDLPVRDFLFEPIDTKLSIYSGLVDQDFHQIIIRNDTDHAVKVQRNMRLGQLLKNEFDGCYHISSEQEDVADLALQRPEDKHRENWFKSIFRKAMTASAVVLLARANLSSPMTSTVPSTSIDTPTVVSPSSAVGVTVSPRDTVLPNGTTVYGNVPEIIQVVDEHLSIWKEQGFADVPEAEWMHIPLRSDWENKAPKTARVYPIGADSRRIIDETFDKLQDQGRLEWTKQSTPFSFPVFIVWTTKADGTRKGRAVVDIQGLNAVTQTDVYALPLQSDIINAVEGCKYITVVDCASFFYQWRVHPQDRHKLTVVTHRGQESFNMAVMSYKNSPAYVQHQIDRLL